MAVPGFFAVGGFPQAFLARSVKGGVRMPEKKRGDIKKETSGGCLKKESAVI